MLVKLVSKFFRSSLCLLVISLSSLAFAAPQVEIKTTLGTMLVELDSEKAPISSKNFLQYAKDGYYKETIFHRVIPDFMVQGGGFDSKMSQKESRPAIQNEAKNGLKNLRGTLAMARTGDPHSASSQFFINLKDNSFLDYPGRDGWGYAVFGKVIKGIEVIDKMANEKTGNVAGHQNVPLTPISIISVTIKQDK